jgi:hypothetical protein
MGIPNALNIEKFAKDMESLIVLYLADDEFKAICDDYCISKMNLEKYRQKLKEDAQCEFDYETVATELEEEILRFIRERK